MTLQVFQENNESDTLGQLRTDSDFNQLQLDRKSEVDLNSEGKSAVESNPR